MVRPGAPRVGVLLGSRGLMSVETFPSESEAHVSIPPACRSIQDEIAGLRQERYQLQDELQHAPPGEKPGLLRLIRMLNLQLAGLQKRSRPRSMYLFSVSTRQRSPVPAAE
jgi:hypothetical protein